MSAQTLIVQLLNGLAGASTLFLVAVGLSLIFGVSRIVNFAHGSLAMVGIYLAWSFIDRLGAGSVLGFWGGIVAAALLTAAIGALIELTVLRRIYAAPELFQLLATFAVALVVRDAVLWLWGPEDLLGPRAPGLKGAVEVLGARLPSYDLLLVAIGPLVLGALWLLLRFTRFGVLLRAATQDREMVAALGVNQAWLFTGVFALGSLLAGLGGALQIPREPANLGMDLITIGEAFVVVVVGVAAREAVAGAVGTLWPPPPLLGGERASWPWLAVPSAAAAEAAAQAAAEAEAATEVSAAVAEVAAVAAVAAAAAV